MSVILKALQTKSPLKYLCSRYQERIAFRSTISQHRQGEKIFDKDGDDDTIAFLIWGEVILKADDGKTCQLNHSQESSSYPLSKLKPRRYSAIAAKSQTCILWINRRLLKECIAKQIIRNEQKLDSDCFEVRIRSPAEIPFEASAR